MAPRGKRGKSSKQTAVDPEVLPAVVAGESHGEWSEDPHLSLAQKIFLAAWFQTGVTRMACRAARISATLVYNEWNVRNPVFAEIWNDLKVEREEIALASWEHAANHRNPEFDWRAAAALTERRDRLNREALLDKVKGIGHEEPERDEDIVLRRGPDRFSKRGDGDAGSEG